MQWDTVSGWNLVLTIIAMVAVIALVRHMIYYDCTTLSRKLHTEVVALVAKEAERTRNLERWLERTERLVMDLRPRVARLEMASVRGEEREVRAEERDVRNEERSERGEAREIRGEARDVLAEGRDIRGEAREVRGEGREVRGEDREIRIEDRTMRQPPPETGAEGRM